MCQGTPASVRREWNCRWRAWRGCFRVLARVAFALSERYTRRLRRHAESHPRHYLARAVAAGPTCRGGSQAHPYRARRCQRRWRGAVLCPICTRRGRATNRCRGGSQTRPYRATERGDGARGGEARLGDPVTLFEVVRALKSFSARRINELLGTPGVPVWQRSYYERVVRGETELARLRRYIAGNPDRWASDPENPS